MNDDTGGQNDFLYKEILSFLSNHHVSGATVFHPDAGFGGHHRVHVKHAAGAEGRHLSVRIEFVEKRERVEALLPELLALVTDGMVEAQETAILKVARRESPLPARKIRADEGIRPYR